MFRYELEFPVLEDFTEELFRMMPDRTISFSVRGMFVVGLVALLFQFLGGGLDQCHHALIGAFAVGLLCCVVGLSFVLHVVLYSRKHHPAFRRRQGGP